MQDFPSQHISTLSLKNKTQLGTLRVRRSFQVWKGDQTVFIGRYWIQVDTRGHWSGSKVGSPAAAGKAPSAGRLVFHPDARRPAGRVRNPRGWAQFTTFKTSVFGSFLAVETQSVESRRSFHTASSSATTQRTIGNKNIVLPHRGNSGFATS